MYHPSSTSCPPPCYGSNTGKTGGPFLPSQPADAFLATAAFLLPSSSSYGLSQPPLLPPPGPQVAQQVIPPTSPSSWPFRRVLSTGDFVADKLAPMARYSAEERRERIHKYRSKRNHRNFQKKITYACRKTLADSRPRVKGRFARNAGDAADADLLQAEQLTETEAPLQMDDDDAQHPKTTMVMNQIVFPGGNANATVVDCIAHADSSGGGTTAAVPECWPAKQEEDLCDADDEDLLAAYLSVSSINLYSYSPRGH